MAPKPKRRSGPRHHSATEAVQEVAGTLEDGSCGNAVKRKVMSTARTRMNEARQHDGERDIDPFSRICRSARAVYGAARETLLERHVVQAIRRNNEEAQELHAVEERVRREEGLADIMAILRDRHDSDSEDEPGRGDDIFGLLRDLFNEVQSGELAEQAEEMLNMAITLGTSLGQLAALIERQLSNLQGVGNTFDQQVATTLRLIDRVASMVERIQKCRGDTTRAQLPGLLGAPSPKAAQQGQEEKVVKALRSLSATIKGQPGDATVQTQLGALSKRAEEVLQACERERPSSRVAEVVEPAARCMNRRDSIAARPVSPILTPAPPQQTDKAVDAPTSNIALPVLLRRTRSSSSDAIKASNPQLLRTPKAEKAETPAVEEEVREPLEAGAPEAEAEKTSVEIPTALPRSRSSSTSLEDKPDLGVSGRLDEEEDDLVGFTPQSEVAIEPVQDFDLSPLGMSAARQEDWLLEDVRREDEEAEETDGLEVTAMRTLSDASPVTEAAFGEALWQASSADATLPFASESTVASSSNCRPSTGGEVASASGASWPPAPWTRLPRDSDGNVRQQLPKLSISRCDTPPSPGGWPQLEGPTANSARTGRSSWTVSRLSVPASGADLSSVTAPRSARQSRSIGSGYSSGVSSGHQFGTHQNSLPQAVLRCLEAESLSFLPPAAGARRKGSKDSCASTSAESDAGSCRSARPPSQLGAASGTHGGAGRRFSTASTGSTGSTGVTVPPLPGPRCIGFNHLQMLV